MATHEFLLAAFSSLLTVSIHTILYERSIYPATTFLRARFHDYPVHQSRHPLVCQWIDDTVEEVAAQLALGTVDRVVVVMYSPMNEPLERFLFDVSRFPVVPRNERMAVMEREDGKGAVRITREVVVEAEGQGGSGSGSGAGPAAATTEQKDIKGKGKATATTTVPTTKAAQEKEADGIHARLGVEMSQQFRALLARLSFLNAKLGPLPSGCTFNVAIELKDEADAPIGHPQAWIPTEPGLQMSGRDYDDGSGLPVGKRKGEHLGGVHTTPVRAVDVGEMLFEVWVEESRVKLERNWREEEMEEGEGEGEGEGGGEEEEEDAEDEDEVADSNDDDTTKPADKKHPAYESDDDDYSDSIHYSDD